MVKNRQTGIFFTGIGPVEHVSKTAYRHASTRVLGRQVRSAPRKHAPASRGGVTPPHRRRADCPALANATAMVRKLRCFSGARELLTFYSKLL